MINSFTNQYRFLSNFYPCWVFYEGISYPSTEHAYQALKSLDIAVREFISNLKSPGEAKRAGREITIRPDWDQVKEGIMYDLLKIKFSTSILKEKLLETRDHELIESNTWHDNTWGICNCKKCDRNGLNLLGILLMKVREELKNN